MRFELPAAWYTPDLVEDLGETDISTSQGGVRVFSYYLPDAHTPLDAAVQCGKAGGS